MSPKPTKRTTVKPRSKSASTKSKKSSAEQGFKPIKHSEPQPTSSWPLLAVSLRLVRNHPFSLLWLVLIPGVLSAIGQVLTPTVQTNAAETSFSYARIWGESAHFYASHPLALTITAIGGLWALLVYPATVVLASQVVRGAGDDPAKFVLDSRHYFWRVFGLTILTGFIIFVGLIALIVPGIIFLRRYILAPYYLVTQDLGIIEAMKLSSAETKPVSGYVWGSIGVAIVVSIASSLFLDVPWIGPLLGPLVGLAYFFGLALRQREIAGE